MPWPHRHHLKSCPLQQQTVRAGAAARASLRLGASISRADSRAAARVFGAAMSELVAGGKRGLSVILVADAMPEESGAQCYLQQTLERVR